MKTKYTMFRRGEMFYMQDSATGKQTSLHTKDETEAKSLLEARNAAQRQPVLNLHLARAYLTASDPAFVERTWSVVKYEPKDRRGITLDEHESVLAKEKNAEWKLFLELLWETGAAQSDAASFTAEDIDWQTRTISYFRQKTGSLAQFTISTALEKVLQQLPTTGVLFPNLSTWSESDRASRFRRRCHKAGVLGVTLHCYRYAWAERAKVVGMPERFAQAALGHNSKAIHRAYAKKAVIIAPTIEDYERKAASLTPAIAA